MVKRLIQALSLAVIVMAAVFAPQPAQAASASCVAEACGCNGTPPPYALESCMFRCGSIGVTCGVSFLCAFLYQDASVIDCV